MKFIEITGKTLKKVITDDEISAEELAAVGVVDDTIVRINEQGDIEIRRPKKWDIIGGLLGGFEDRLHKTTGMDWA